MGQVDRIVSPHGFFDWGSSGAGGCAVSTVAALLTPWLVSPVETGAIRNRAVQACAARQDDLVLGTSAITVVLPARRSLRSNGDLRSNLEQGDVERHG